MHDVGPNSDTESGRQSALGIEQRDVDRDDTAKRWEEGGGRGDGQEEWEGEGEEMGGRARGGR